MCAKECDWWPSNFGFATLDVRLAYVLRFLEVCHCATPRGLYRRHHLARSYTPAISDAPGMLGSRCDSWLMRGIRLTGILSGRDNPNTHKGRPFEARGGSPWRR